MRTQLQVLAAVVAGVAIVGVAVVVIVLRRHAKRDRDESHRTLSERDRPHL